MANAKTLFIVDGREPVWKSWLRDSYTFGTLIGASVAANTLMPPSGWINFTLSAVWLIWIFGRSNRRKVFMTAEQARAWIDANYPRGAA